MANKKTGVVSLVTLSFSSRSTFFSSWPQQTVEKELTSASNKAITFSNSMSQFTSMLKVEPSSVAIVIIFLLDLSRVKERGLRGKKL